MLLPTNLFWDHSALLMEILRQYPQICFPISCVCLSLLFEPASQASFQRWVLRSFKDDFPSLSQIVLFPSHLTIFIRDKSADGKMKMTFFRWKLTFLGGTLNVTGFFESRRACCGTGTVETSFLCNSRSVGTCSNATGYVFWDGFHPTEAANQVLAGDLLTQGFSLIWFSVATIRYWQFFYNTFYQTTLRLFHDPYHTVPLYVEMLW